MRTVLRLTFLLPLIFLVFVALPLGAEVFIQCPGDVNGDGISDDPNIVCIQLTAGDGFVSMADGTPMYVFGFNDVTGIPADMIMDEGMLAANFSAPLITAKEGQQVYLSLTNVGMTMRPDLFDPHTVHFHGFPNAAPVFDGEPFASIAIVMGSTLTYYYNIVFPGTYMYHCHVEAVEHMQMGMLGSLFMRPIQDDNAGLKDLGIQPPLNQPFEGFAYNDGDGSTGYHVVYPLQIASFDPLFHAADEEIQPLAFAKMRDVYPMLNGRGYPDTINPNPLAPPILPDGSTGKESQKISSLITATSGQKILLRISSLSTTSFHTLSALGIPMKVVGRDARLLRGPTGNNLYYDTNSITLGGGQSADVILDTTNVSAGTYFLYVTNLDHLNNDAEEYGGMMTEIVIN